MRPTTLAVLSAMTIAHGAGAGPGSARGDEGSAHPAAAVRRLTACHGTPAEIAALESHVAARMPGHGRAFHRRLAAAIHEEAVHAGFDPLLVLALIHVESAFDPEAVSPAGAVGLMQLHETTMRQEAERSRLGRADPRDPVANVRAGVRYLRRLVATFGSTDLALMAYNAGPNRIGSYRRAGGVPERFHAYPRRVRGEVQRLRVESRRR
jgi:soluble lytic murein transglycosylase-like protein